MAKMKGSFLNYEAHITIEPIFDDEKRQNLNQILLSNGFRLAELLMKKRTDDTPERSQYDSFCTARSDSALELHDRTRACVKTLQDKGFTVYRYKLEETLIDVRI